MGHPGHCYRGKKKKKKTWAITACIVCIQPAKDGKLWSCYTNAKWTTVLFSLWYPPPSFYLLAAFSKLCVQYLLNTHHVMGWFQCYSVTVCTHIYVSFRGPLKVPLFFLRLLFEGEGSSDISTSGLGLSYSANSRSEAMLVQSGDSSIINSAQGSLSPCCGNSFPSPQGLLL